MVKYPILFLCVANASRSQMAQAIGRSLTEKYPEFDFDSAGQSPATKVDSGLLPYLESVGLSAVGQFPKTLKDVRPLDEYKAVVVLCEESCVILPETQTPVHPWNLPDPTRFAGEKRDAQYRLNHETIVERLIPLLDKIKDS